MKLKKVIPFALALMFGIGVAGFTSNIEKVNARKAILNQQNCICGCKDTGDLSNCTDCGCGDSVDQRVQSQKVKQSQGCGSRCGAGGGCGTQQVQQSQGCGSSCGSGCR